jgi:cell division transport system permease protein
MRALRRALDGLREYPVLALATASTVATVLVLLGAFGGVILNLSSVLDRWGQDVQVSCYLLDSVDDEAIFRLKADMEAMDEVASVAYVSKAEALERFGQTVEGMERILADLDHNPLPASLEVRLHETWQSPEEVRRVAGALARPEFEELDYSREWVERFHTFVSLMRASALLLGALLLAGAVFLVGNTIRVAIYARRGELRIVRLVGGTRWFARIPFLIEGLLLGFTGGGVAAALLLVLHRYALSRLQGLLDAFVGADLLPFLPPRALVALILAGTAVGLLGAFTSVMRAGEDVL